MRGCIRTLPRASFLCWPNYQGETTIEAVASRIIEEHHITSGHVLIGSSLGGIVSCEIARLCGGCQRLVLIGSAVSPAEIHGLLRALRSLARFAPVEFIQRAAGKIPGDLTQMFQKSDPHFIHAMCHAIFKWKGLQPDLPKPFRIHGKHDKVVPLPAAVDQVIEGGHLIAMTHPEECLAAVHAALSLKV